MSERIEPNGPGYIYLIQSGEFYKIGRSIDPLIRLRELKSYKSEGPDLTEPLIVVMTLLVASMSKAEKALHAHFSDRRVGGEWFKLSGDDVMWLAAQNHASLNELYNSQNEPVEFVPGQHGGKREGAGRKVKSESERKVKRSVSLAPIVDDIVLLAQRPGESYSEVVERLLLLSSQYQD